MEPPASLVTNILASTTGVDTQRLRMTVRAPQPRVRGWSTYRPRSARTGLGDCSPARFAMSFGMAFFALSVGLTVAGVKPADFSRISLRPSAIRYTYYNTQARVVHYYENVRIVYEVEAAFANEAQPGSRRARPASKQRRKTRTTQHNSPSRSRSAITARRITISFWLALTGVQVLMGLMLAICL